MFFQAYGKIVKQLAFVNNKINQKGNIFFSFLIYIFNFFY